MRTQLLILLSSPALEPTGRVALLCQVFQTLGFLLCLPWTARWWATGSPQTSVHQQVLHTRLSFSHHHPQHPLVPASCHRLTELPGPEIFPDQGHRPHWVALAPADLLSPEPLVAPCMPSFSSPSKYVSKPRHGKLVHPTGQVH